MDQKIIVDQIRLEDAFYEAKIDDVNEKNLENFQKQKTFGYPSLDSKNLHQTNIRDG